MNIPKNKKIWLACSKDDSRKPLQCVQFDGENLTATNGHILAVVKPDIEEGEKPCLIPASILKLSRVLKTQLGHIVELGEKISVFVNPNNAYIKESIEPYNERPFPPTKKATESAKKLLKDKNSIRIGLNANLLFILSQALGDKELVLYFDKKELIETGTTVEVIGVKTPFDASESNPTDFGIIMPIRVEI